MVLRGFDESTMRKAFDCFLHNHRTISSGSCILFNTRSVSHSGGANNPNLNDKEIQASEEKFKNDMALLYLKTFYGKSPDHFKTEAYKKECERLSSFISSSSSPNALKAGIEKCLRNAHVDYASGELPQNLFYERLKDIGLSTDDADKNHAIFVSPYFYTQARIYINPSQKDYGHLMTFLYERAASQELEIGTKTRMLDIRGSALDNMIVYTSAKDFPKIVEILNEYGKTYPDKVAQFGDTIECLGRSEQEWFGFGFDPQRDAHMPIGYSTFNSAMDNLFNSYIFPAIMFDDFNEITRGMSETQLSEIFVNACKDPKLAKEVALSLKDSKHRRQFIKNFCDLTHLKEKSEGYTRDNARLSDAERNGCSPEQLRFNGEQMEDFSILQKENIQIPLLDGRSVQFPRYEIAGMLRSPLLRTAMEKFYDSSAKIDREASQMSLLWKYAGKNTPYLNDEYPFLSNDMVREIDKYSTMREAALRSETTGAQNKKLPENERELKIEKLNKRKKEIIDLLRGGSMSLSIKLIEMGATPMDVKGLSKEELQEMVINKIGIDKVIDATDFVKSVEDDDAENYPYEITLQKLREKRGQRFYDRIMKLASKQAKEQFLKAYSQHVREDFMAAYQQHKNDPEM